MSIITIILFFVYTYGLGFSVTHFLKNSDNIFERNLMRIGIGLALMPFLLVLLNFLHIPLDWRIVLVISLLIPLYTIIKNKGQNFKLPKINLTKSNIYVLIVLLIFSLTLFMYAKGAFVYPYFEDDDPWPHATGIKYVSIEKNLRDTNNQLFYIQPYPPGYDALMGVLHQTSPSLMWTMKFFNALIISLGIIFFYFFSKRFIQNRNKAIIATVILAMVPCYLSHFIWAHSLVITLFLVSLYCLVKINDDKKWIYPLIFVISGITLTQPSQPIKYLIMFMIYILIKSLYDGKFKIKEFIAIIAGYMLSLFWWAANFKGQIMTKSVAAASKEEILGGPLIKFWHIVQTRFSPTSGSATRAYTFNDFFVAKSQNMINNPIGIGIIISLLAILTIFLIIFTYKSMKKEKKSWIIITALWLVFTFLGVNSMTFNLPVGLFAFRFWMLFAIPLSIIAAEGFWFLTKLFKEIKMPRVITISLLILLIFLTSGQQKYTVNTANWGPGQMWTSMEEIQGYTWLKTLPVDTKVFAYSSDEQVIGYDKLSCKWCDEVIEFRKGLLYRNESEVYTWLKKQRYEYLIMDGMAYKSHQEEYGNETKPLIDQRLAEISSSSKFQVVHQTQGVIIFKII